MNDEDIERLRECGNYDLRLKQITSEICIRVTVNAQIGTVQIALGENDRKPTQYRAPDETVCCGINCKMIARQKGGHKIGHFVGILIGHLVESDHVRI